MSPPILSIMTRMISIGSILVKVISHSKKDWWGKDWLSRKLDLRKKLEIICLWGKGSHQL